MVGGSLRQHVFMNSSQTERGTQLAILWQLLGHNDQLRGSEAKLIKTHSSTQCPIHGLGPQFQTTLFPIFLSLSPMLSRLFLSNVLRLPASCLIPPSEATMCILRLTGPLGLKPLFLKPPDSSSHG